MYPHPWSVCNGRGSAVWPGSGRCDRHAPGIPPVSCKRTNRQAPHKLNSLSPLCQIFISSFAWQIPSAHPPPSAHPSQTPPTRANTSASTNPTCLLHPDSVLGCELKGNKKYQASICFLLRRTIGDLPRCFLLLQITTPSPPPSPAPLLVPLQPRCLSALIWLRWALMFCRNWVGKGRDCSREGGGGGRVERVMVRFHMEVILHLSLSNDRPLFVQSLSWLVQVFFYTPSPPWVLIFFFFFLAWGLLGRRAFSYILSRICYYEHQMGSLRRGTRGGGASLGINVHYSFNGRKKKKMILVERNSRSIPALPKSDCFLINNHASRSFDAVKWHKVKWAYQGSVASWGCGGSSSQSPSPPL